MESRGGWPKTASEMKAAGYASQGVWTRCRSCNARIVWVETPNGKKMPVEQVEVPEGEPARYQSHFSTCPQARRHRSASR